MTQRYFAKDILSHFAPGYATSSGMKFKLHYTVIVLRKLNSTNNFPEKSKAPSGGILIKRCSENIQEIYRRTPMPNYNLNKFAKQRS